MVVLSVTLTILSIIAIGLHTLGIYLLRQPNSLQTNQKLYLTHLSILEILMVTTQNTALYLKLFVTNSMFYEYALFIMYAVGFTWNHVLIMLTFDRFLQVYLNIKYQVFVTKIKIKMIILFSYFLGIFLTLILLVVNIRFHNAHQITRLYIYLLYGALQVIMLVFAYVYIYCKIRVGRSSQRVQSANYQRHQRRRSTFVPFWIIATYILFIVIPGVAYVFSLNIFHSNYMHYIWRMCWIIDFIADALIYIFLNESIKNKFLRLIKWKQESLPTGRGTFVLELPLRTISNN